MHKCDLCLMIQEGEVPTLGNWCDLLECPSYMKISGIDKIRIISDEVDMVYRGSMYE